MILKAVRIFAGFTNRWYLYWVARIAGSENPPILSPK